VFAKLEIIIYPKKKDVNEKIYRGNYTSSNFGDECFIHILFLPFFKIKQQNYYYNNNNYCSSDSIHSY